MPPIDPRLIPQQPQGQTLAGPPPAMPPYYPEPSPQSFPGAQAPMSLPPRVQQTQQAETARLAIAKSAENRAQTDFTNQQSAIFDPGTIDFYAHTMLTGGQMPSTGFGGGKVAATNKQLVMKRVADIAKQLGTSGADFATQQAHYKAASKRLGVLETQRGVIGQNEQTALLNGQQFIDRSSELPLQTDYPAVNAITQFGQKHLAFPGQETKSAMDSAWMTFLTEYAKVVQGTPSGAGVLSDSARHEAMDTLQNNLSLAQKKAAFAQLKTDMANRIKALDKGLEEAYGNLTKLPELENSLGSSEPTEAVGDKKLSTTEKAIPIPEGLQSEHAALLAKYPPGTLTIDEYKQIREKLDEEFKTELKGAHSRLDDPELKTFVDDYNKGAPISKIPAMNVPLGSVKDFTLSDPLNTKPLEHLHATVSESAPGVALENMGNAGSLGLVDLAAGKEGREALALNDTNHPAAALIGEIAGSVGGMSALEKLGARGLKMVGGKIVKMSAKEIEDATARTVARDAEATARQKLAGDVAVNTGYGSARGFNSADKGQGVSGAVKGGVAGTVAALGGNAVTKGVTPLLSDSTAKALQQLKGVKLTTLQRLGLGKVEAAATSVPLAHGARSAAVRSFNRANADRALSYIGQKVPKNIEPGTAMNAYVDQTLGNAYNEIRPKIVGSIDGQFEQGIAALKGLATRSKDERNMQAEIDNAVHMFADENGHYTGQGYKEATAELRSLQKTWAADTDGQAGVFAQRMARRAEQARKQMQFLIQRQTPEVGARLKSIERGWAHKMRIEDASNRAMTADDTAVYSPNHLLAAGKKFDTSINKGATARGKGFDQPFAEAGAKIMGGGNVPKISLRDTGYALVGLGATGYAAPAAAPFFATAVAGAYGPGVKKGVQLLLTGQRPKAVDNLIVRRALEDYMRHKETGEK